MNFRLKLGQIGRSAPSRPASKKRHRFGATVEALEARLVFSADLGITSFSFPNTGQQATGNLTFAVSVKNFGPDPAAATVLTDTLTLPAGAMFVSESSSGGSVLVSGNTFTVNFGTLASGATGTLTVNAVATRAGTYTNAASVTSQTPDSDPSNNSSSSSSMLRGPDTVTLTSSTNSPGLNKPVAFTVMVRPPSGLGLPTPTGTVTFFDASTSLGSVALDASGNATFVAPSLVLGHHPITASYLGDANYASHGSTIPLYVTDLGRADFVGDGTDNLTVYGKLPNSTLNGFETLTRATGYDPTKAVIFNNQGFGFGNPSSIPVVGDYFGDGKAAYGIWSPDGHGFMLLQAISSVNPTRALSVGFGLTSDVPVVADVDGDGKADFGVFGLDPNLGYRYDFLLSSKNFDPKQALIFNNYGFGYGAPGASPVVADFDGSGHAGFGVYIPSGNNGTFYYTNVAIPQQTVSFIVNPPATVYFNRSYAGAFAGDIPMAVDYDGDGRADLALYGLDPRTGRYRYDILTSTSNFNKDVYFDNAGLGYGYSASIPVMANYEGNGFADFGVFQPDGHGGRAFIFQDVSVGHGVVYDFAGSTGLPVTAPTFLLAKKVRGQ